MLLCYIDESGTCEPYRSEDPGSTPVFVLAGISVTKAKARALTMEYVKLKKEFEPTLQGQEKTLSDIIRYEVKGSTLRRDVRNERAGRNTRRKAIRFMSRVVDLLEDNGCRIMGKVIVKPDGKPITDRRQYPKAVQELALTFNSQAAASDTDGVMILDSRTKVKNEGNVHAITTRRFRSGGDFYPRLIEAPVFGHSDTHLPLQIVDIVASGILYPIACHEYTEAAASNTHRHDRYSELKQEFGSRMQKLEHRYVNAEGETRGGFQVVDLINHRATHLLFRS